MNAQHTPGPWPIKTTGDGKRIRVGIGLVEGPRGYDVAEVYSDDCDRTEAEANASLIAAAPDLLAALEAMRDDPTIKAVCRSPLWAQMVDAIAKARKP